MSKYIGDKNYSEKERWICIYPAYINSKRTVAEGRRIPKDKAVENPTYQEILEVLNNLGLNNYAENKLYCKEPSKESAFRGRVRVQLRNEDGTSVNPLYPTRNSIMLYLSTSIPKLKSRTTKGGTENRSETSSKKKGKGRK